MQARYPGIMRGQPADAKFDWGLLVVLIAAELRKKNTDHITGNTVPAKVQLHLVLETCNAISDTKLKELVAKFVSKAGWS